jgi:hypothetical protein
MNDEFKKLMGTVESSTPLDNILSTNKPCKNNIKPMSGLYLADIINNPYINKNTRRKKMNLTTYMENEIIKELGENKLMLQGPFKLSDTHGRPDIFVIPTVKGYNYFRMPPKKTEQFFTRLMTYYVWRYYKNKGYRVKKEVLLSNKDRHLIDLVAYSSEEDTKGTLIEIETGKSEWLFNLKRIFSAGYQEVKVVCPCDRKLVEHLQKKIILSFNEETARNVSIRTIAYYYKKVINKT